MRLKGLKQFGKELASIVRNKKVLIPVIAVLTVPVMYTAMFLGAFWDPYDRLEDLPVAIVNGDEGTLYEGKELHIGLDFEQKLKDNPTFNWAFVSKETALQGLADNEYYMAIEIPADFSQRTASLTTDTPEPARLSYLPNESFNFLAAQIGNTAVEQMKSLLNKEVTETYTRTVFEQLEEVADGIGRAGDGAVEIADGTAKAKDGALLLKQNINKLAGGALSLKDGADKLSAAGQQLLAGSTELSDGAAALADGIGQLSGASGKLEESASGAQQAASQLAGRLEESAAGTAELEAGAAQLRKGLEQLAQSNSELGSDQNFQALLAASQQLEGGLAKAALGHQQLSTGAVQLNDGMGKLGAGIDVLGQKLTEVNAGASALSAGAQQLDGGSAELAEGLTRLDSSIHTLAAGMQQLEDGSTEIATGLEKLDDGTNELSTKLTDASLQSSNIALTDQMADMFADPIRLEVSPVTQVPNYGTGFAPYFLSLGLYVGALLLTIVYTLREPAVKPDNGWSWFWSKALTLIFIGIIQALIADAALIFLLKLEVQSLPYFLLFSILTSIAFMMLVQFLVTTLGNPGRFIAIVILIFQLTSSAGTFPLELIPGWLQHAAPWLPMTYSVAGLKTVISSGDFGAMWHYAALLMGYAVIFGALTLAYFSYSHRRNKAASAVESAALA